MFSATCSHCLQLIVEHAERLTESDLLTMRLHLAYRCPRIVLDLYNAPVGELLKEYVVSRTDGALPD